MRFAERVFSHGDAQLFLALSRRPRGGPRQRQYDDNFNAFHNNRLGHVRLPRARGRADILPALLEVAEDLAARPRPRSHDRADGLHDERRERRAWSTASSGCRSSSSLGIRRNYAARCEEAGLEKAVDLFMYELVISDRTKILPVVFKLAEQVEPRHASRSAACRGARCARTWTASPRSTTRRGARNWGFVPYSKRDLDVYAQEMQLVFDQNWFMVAETAEGDTAAIAITIPDINQVLMKMKGRLLPLGWLVLPAQGEDHGPGPRRVPRRQALLPAHGGRGGLLRRAFRHRHARRAEVGRDGLDPRDQPQHWNRAMEAMGGRIVRRFRSTNGVL